MGLATKKRFSKQNILDSYKVLITEFETLEFETFVALNLCRAYSVAYANGPRRCQHLYLYAGVSVSLCNNTATH